MYDTLKTIDNNYDVIVIGAGIAGLTLAATLSKEGKKILVVERNAFVGGNCSSFLLDNKFRFDFAVHQIAGAGPGGLTYDVLCELDLEKKISFLKIDPILQAVFPKKDFIFPIKIEKLIQNLEKEFPKERKQIHKFFKKMLHIRNTVVFVYYFSSKRKLAGMSFSKIPLLKKLLIPFYIPFQIKLFFISWQKYCDSFFKNKELISVLSSLWVYAGLPPKKVSAMMMTAILSDYHFEKFYYPEDGSQNISESFADAIRKNGSQILLKNKVNKIITKRNKAVGIKLENGKEIKAAIIVSNAEPAVVFNKMLSNKPAQKYKQKLNNLELSTSAVKILIATKLPLHENPKINYENIYYSNIDLEKVYSDSQKANPSFVDIYIPTLIDSSLTLPSYHNVLITTFIAYKSWEKIKDSEQEKDLIHKMISLAENIIPKLSKNIEFMKVLTPDDIHNQTLTRNAAMYGWANTTKQTFFKRLKEKTPVKNLYLCGHYTGSAGISTNIVSGWKLAKKLLEKKNTTAIFVSLLFLFFTGFAGGFIAAIIGSKYSILIMFGYYFAVFLYRYSKNII